MRTIPAHAGQTHGRLRDSRWLADHPRTCGANKSPADMWSTFHGPSPHMRGKQRRFGTARALDRTIPAHAGQTVICYAKMRSFGERFSLIETALSTTTHLKMLTPLFSIQSVNVNVRTADTVMLCSIQFSFCLNSSASHWHSVFLSVQAPHSRPVSIPVHAF